MKKLVKEREDLKNQLYEFSSKKTAYVESKFNK